MKELIIYTHSDCLLKDNGIVHPERKERLLTIINSINEIEKIKIQNKLAPLANLEDIYLVHNAKYINDIFLKIPEAGLVTMEKEPYADTFLCPNSKNAILRSCGSGIAAADNLIINNNEMALKKYFLRMKGWSMALFINLPCFQDLDLRMKMVLEIFLMRQ